MSRFAVPARWEAAFWSIQSYTWDDYLQFPECRAEIEATADWLAQHLPVTARVLDVGCGTGNYALALAEHGCTVLGIDFSAGMLKRARTKAARILGAQANFERVNMNASLPFPVAAFDGVIAVAVLQCALDPLCLLHELHRVLRPGGVFLLMALDPTQRSAAKRKLPTTLSRWIVHQIKVLGNRSQRVQRYTRTEIEQFLADTGFELIGTRSSEGMLGLLCAARDALVQHET